MSSSASSFPEHAHADSRYNVAPVLVSPKRNQVLKWLLAATFSSVGFFVIVLASVMHRGHALNDIVISCMYVTGVLLLVSSPVVVFWCFKRTDCCFSPMKRYRHSRQPLNPQRYSQRLPPYWTEPQGIVDAPDRRAIMGHDPSCLPNTYSYQNDPQFPGVHPQFSTPPPSYDSIFPSSPNSRN